MTETVCLAAPGSSFIRNPFWFRKEKRCLKTGLKVQGAIVGSAIIRIIAQYGKDAPEQVGRYVAQMKAAL